MSELRRRSHAPVGSSGAEEVCQDDEEHGFFAKVCAYCSCKYCKTIVIVEIQDNKLQ